MVTGSPKGIQNSASVVYVTHDTDIPAFRPLDSEGGCLHTQLDGIRYYYPSLQILRGGHGATLWKAFPHRMDHSGAVHASHA